MMNKQAEESLEMLPISKRWRLLLSLVVVSYVFCSVFWLGRQSANFAVDEPLKPLRQVWFFLGLDQDWRLFGPEVRTFNCRPSAIIGFDNGAKLLWQPPVGEEFDDKLRLNCHRKWTIDYLLWPLYTGYWWSLSQFITSAVDTNDMHPREFTLFINFSHLNETIQEVKGRDGFARSMNAGITPKFFLQMNAKQAKKGGE